MYKIFIIEDDTALASAIKSHLEAWGYEVQCVRNFRNPIEEISIFQPHLILLDIMLPFYDGYHWCREIRKISNLPIVFLSSASDNMNLIMAINMGGDDFISKPVDAGVLLAKVQAVLRRSYDLAGQANILEHNGVVLNLNDFSVVFEGKRIDLTKNEYLVFETLFRNIGKIVSRDTLMMRLWQNDDYVEENTLTVNITRLRKKLEELGLTDFIKTKVGSGYYIEL